MTSETLRECPFCGGADLYNAFPKSAAECGVIACRACGAEGPDAGPGRHIAAWNTRSLPAALDVVIREVEAMPAPDLDSVARDLVITLHALRALRAADTAPETQDE